MQFAKIAENHGTFFKKWLNRSGDLNNKKKRGKSYEKYQKIITVHVFADGHAIGHTYASKRGGEAELQAAERLPMKIAEEAALTISYRDLPAILDCYLNYITM